MKTLRATRIRRRTSIAAATGTVTVMFLAACGGDGEPTSTPGEGDEPAAAEDVSFEGTTIDLVVGYDAGGSYDDAARWLQPRLEEVTGATVVVANMPGAGNLIALNRVWASAPDGTTIGTLNGPGNTVTVMTGTATESLEFQLEEFSYLVGLTSEPRLMTVAADSPYESFEDILDSGDEILLGVTGTSGAGYNDAVFMQSVFGDRIDAQIVSGFESGAENQLALVRGEVDASFNLLGGELPAIEAGEVRGLVVLGSERSPQLPDVPAIVEYDLSDEVLEMLDVHITVSQLGIILIAPPDMPADLLAALQDAVYEAATDQELVEEAQSRGVNWVPRTGDEVHAAVVEALNAPEDYVALMRAAVAE